MSEFPNDVALDILSRLPLKPLMRFRCVQKSWSDLPKNLNFMRMCSQRSTFDFDDSSFLFCYQIPHAYVKHARNSKLSLLSGERYKKMVDLDWPSPLRRDGQVLIMGSCINGIICLYQRFGKNQKIVLWNPTIEEFKVIPSGLFDSPGIGFVTYNVGFGYDHVKKDYKIIRIVHSLLDSEDERLYVRGDDGLVYWECPDVPEPLWQIYSLKRDCWRKLDLNLDFTKSQVYDDSVYLNGLCHFWGHGPDESKEAGRMDELLMSFDMGSETFVITPIPTNLVALHNSVEKRLVVFNGSIAMISNSENSCFDISILGEVGVKESWIKLFTIGPFPCFICPVGNGNKGEILFIKNDDELVWFDFSTQMIVEINIERRGKLCQIITYKENLHPIEGFYKE